MFPYPLAVVDLETTGTAATGDRITEIGIVRVADGAVLEEWSTLVNPGMAIPPEIQALTGISDAMVRDAPSFADVCGEVHARLAGHLFVAHNARFDYGFIKNAFRRMGMPFTAEVLCTVRLSRRMYPGHARHNLDSLVERHGLQGDGRHRALGDARLAWQFLQTVMREKPRGDVEAAVKALLKMPSLPPQLAPGALDHLPEGPGVYVFHGVNDLPIYIGKSVNLRDRVRSHFSGDHRNSNDARISQELVRIDFEETAGELGALLREAELVKRCLPLLNQRLRRNRQLVFIRLRELADMVSIVPLADVDFGDTAGLYGPFPAKPRARALLLNLAAQAGLCWSALGARQRDGPCFARQIHRCRGLCVGAETLVQHNVRLAAALAGYRFRAWPHPGPVAIRETHADHGWQRLHVVDRWHHLGSARTDDEVFDLAQARAPLEFDPDVYRILSTWFARNPSGAQVVDLAAHARGGGASGV